MGHWTRFRDENSSANGWAGRHVWLLRVELYCQRIGPVPPDYRSRSMWALDLVSFLPGRWSAPIPASWLWTNWEPNSVPIMWKSCGVMTTSDFTPELAECDTTSQTLKSEANYCNTTVSWMTSFPHCLAKVGVSDDQNKPYVDSLGNQAGESIFVLVDCNTNELLPMSKQDPIYQRPGVCATC